MTISTISPGIGLNPVVGAAASIDEHLSTTARQPIGAPATDSAPSVNFNASPPAINPPSHIAVTPVVNGLGLGLRFSTDPVTGTAVITVVDVDNGEVVRQIPAEEVLDFMRQFESSKGALISKKL